MHVIYLTHLLVLNSQLFVLIIHKIYMRAVCSPFATMMTYE